MSVINRDALGDRMKRYENITQQSLPPRTYTILRVDGRAFHTWTKGLSKPYDTDLMSCMDAAALSLCEEVSGTQFAFVQSDEISLLAVDFLDIKSQPWFSGNIQKWVSVSASIATQAFNSNLLFYIHDNQFMRKTQVGRGIVTKLGDKKPNAIFDARVYTIPDFIEVENYFVWRQKDAVRNSVTMLAQAYASHKQLQGKSTAARHEIIHLAGDNWSKHPIPFKHGRVVRRAKEDEASQHSGTNWLVDAQTPVFTKDREYLRGLVPIPWENDMIARIKPTEAPQ